MSSENTENKNEVVFDRAAFDKTEKEAIEKSKNARENKLKELYSAKGEAITKIEIYTNKLNAINNEIKKAISVFGDKIS